MPCVVLVGMSQDQDLGRGEIQGALSGAEAMGPILSRYRRTEMPGEEDIRGMS